ncbi:MAG: hypothetical protein AAGD43_02565 [Pseudomonadota bacterium]
MGDRSDAAALQIAERKLIRMGCEWGPKELAMFAAETLMEFELLKEQGRNRIATGDTLEPIKSDMTLRRWLEKGCPGLEKPSEGSS